MSESNIPLKELLKYLHKLANNSLSLWDLPKGASAELINVSENATYLVTAENNHRSILRVHREKYHTQRAIQCELAWIDALRNETSLTTPDYYLGKDGSAIQEAYVSGLENSRFMVLFHFLEGSLPNENSNTNAGYEELGALAAQCHMHAISWKKPQPFERLTWDLNAVFGSLPTWGDWRNAPEVTPEIKNILEQVEETICDRLEAYGKSSERYNLIHADMRLANLLVDPNGTKLIDFDDCGYGWLMYDFATAISFIEDDPRVPNWKTAWLKGYQSLRNLSDADIVEIDTFVMLRRMALLAWIGSHIEAPEPQELAPGFAATTASLGREWIEKIS